jgi:hypothetical protein
MADILISVGTVVASSDDGAGHQNRVVPAAMLTYSLGPPVGVMLTNGIQTDVGGGEWDGGWVVVGSVDPMVVKLDTATAARDPACPAELFETSVDPGCASDQFGFSVADTAGPQRYGQILPSGPQPGDGIPYRYITWQPETITENTQQRAANLVITSSTALVDYAVAYVKAGRRYALEAELVFTADVAGGIDVAWSASGATTLEQIAGELFSETPAVALADLKSGMAPGVTRLQAAGPTGGLARVRGIFTATADGTVSIQASQHVSNGAATTVYSVSWFRVAEV